jgi:hypothetical protein
MDIGLSASRAALRSARPEGRFPLVSAFAAGERSVYHLNCSSLNSQCSSVDQDVCDLMPGRFRDVPEGLAGNSHFRRGLGMVQALQVGETERFELIARQTDLLETGQGNSGRLEILAPRTARDPAADQRPGHRAIPG